MACSVSRFQRDADHPEAGMDRSQQWLADHSFFCFMLGIGMVIVKKHRNRRDDEHHPLVHLMDYYCDFPFAASQWVGEAEDYFWLFVMGILGSIGHLAAVSGFKIADASSVMPMDFLRLVWISLFGSSFWRNTRGLDPDWCRSDFSRQRFVDDSFQILNPLSGPSY